MFRSFFLLSISVFTTSLFAQSNLGVYNCIAIETYTQQQYPPVVVTSNNISQQICASSQGQAQELASPYFNQFSTPFWKVTPQCMPEGQVPFPLCNTPGQQL